MGVFEVYTTKRGKCISCADYNMKSSKDWLTGKCKNKDFAGGKDRFWNNRVCQYWTPGGDTKDKINKDKKYSG